MVGPDGSERIPVDDRGEHFQGFVTRQPGLFSGGNTRWVSLGCGAIVVILLSILVAGMFEVDRGMRLIAERAQERVLELLPHELDPKQRQEIARGMERLLEEAEHASEGGDIISSFVRVVGSLVEDGRLTAEEIDQLDLFLKGSKSDPTVRAD